MEKTSLTRDQFWRALERSDAVEFFTDADVFDEKFRAKRPKAENGQSFFHDVLQLGHVAASGKKLRVNNMMTLKS